MPPVFEKHQDTITDATFIITKIDSIIPSSIIGVPHSAIVLSNSVVNHKVAAAIPIILADHLNLREVFILPIIFNCQLKSRYNIADNYY